VRFRHDGRCCRQHHRDAHRCAGEAQRGHAWAPNTVPIKDPRALNTVSWRCHATIPLKLYKSDCDERVQRMRAKRCRVRPWLQSIVPLRCQIGQPWSDEERPIPPRWPAPVTGAGVAWELRSTPRPQPSRRGRARRA
jgi:hypothetical protein